MTVLKPVCVCVCAHVCSCMHVSCSIWKRPESSGAGSSQPGMGDVQTYLLWFSTCKSNRSEFVTILTHYINRHNHIGLSKRFIAFFTVPCIIQFISKHQTWRWNPLPLLRERKIIIFFLLRYIWMKNAYLWDVKHLIRRLTLPHSCPCLQSEAVPTVEAVWGCFPAVLFGCFHHCGDPSLAQHVVYPKFAFNQERSQVLLVLYSVCLTANSHYTSSILATLFYFSGNSHHTK